MIKSFNDEHLAAVKAFAESVGALPQLEDKLDYLANYGDGDMTCELHADWAPHSFAFAMTRPDGSRWFNGGLIYSGPGQPLDGSFPALTVGIGVDSSKHSWSVHT